MTAAVTLSAAAAAQDGRVFLDRIGAYVESYYSRAQRIVATEVVTLQPLTRDFGFDGFARRLEYELRVEWNPEAPEGTDPATVVRTLIKASGPRLGPPDQPDCLDPRAVSPEPLAFLLPARRDKYTFSLAGAGRANGREALLLDYKPVAPEPPKVEWNRDCAWVELPGRTRGRVWADPENGGVLRFDEHLVGQVDIPGPTDRRRAAAPRWFTFQRADTSTYYEPVTFTDPDETLLLPSRIESVTVILNSGVPRMRVTQAFSNYRRFVTASRIVE